MSGFDDADFSELLGLEEGQNLVIKKDGEEVKHMEGVKQEEKVMENKEAGVDFVDLSGNQTYGVASIKEERKEVG